MQKKRTFKAAFTCRWAPSDGKDGENGKDGIGIKSADVVFTTSTSSTALPDMVIWYTLFSQLTLTANTYIWSCTKITLTNGTTSYTGKQCLGASKDFVTIIEQYAIGSSGTTAPTSGWGTSYTPTKELWLWTRNRMKWTNGTYSYTTPICIGYFGKDGTDGEDGNGISSQTSYFVATDKPKVASYSSVSGWSITFPTATEQKPYVWKCVKTTYTKTGTTYTTPELIATYHSGDNANIIDNASFVDSDHMAAWNAVSEYSPLSGKTAPSDKGKIDTNNRVDNRCSYFDTCKATGASINYKEVLRQTIHQPNKNINKLAGGQWYTFSFWARGNQNVITVNETSSNYGFARKDLYLTAGVTYRITIVGKIDSTTLSNGKELRTFIFNDSWSESESVATKSTSMTAMSMEFTPKTNGEYHIASYVYDDSEPRTGKAEVLQYQIYDNRDLTTYIFPTLVDTSTKIIVDGVEQGSTPSDLNHTWALTSQWKRHTITFKTKASIPSSDNQQVLFRLQPAPNEEAYRNVWICMPKLESGMFATGFVDGINDLKGIPGLIERTSEWTAGAEYHNDESLTGGIRYLDIVTVTDNATGDFTMYQCRVTHTSTTANAPNGSDSTEWLKLNPMRPIYTPLIVAKNAVLRFAQTNRLLIMNKDGTKVQACMQGTEDEINGYTFWSGGETAAQAKTRIAYNGSFYTKDGYFEGSIFGVNGSFQKLYGSYTASDGTIYENKSSYMYFDPVSTQIGIKGDFRLDGSMSIYGDDILHNGTGKSGGKFRASDMYVRGSFGARSRTIGVVSNNTMSVYIDGGTQLIGTTTFKKNQKDNFNWFDIPCFTTDADGFTESGVPVDTIIILEPSMGDYRYAFNLQNTQKITVVYAKNNPSRKVYIRVCGKDWNLNGGGCLELLKVPTSYISPTQSDPGAGVMAIGYYDNNW